MKNKPNNNMLIQFLGVRRSGTHAVSRWLRNNLDYNDITHPEYHNDVFAPQRVDPPAGPRIFSTQDLIVRAPSSGNSMVLINYEDVPVNLVPQLATIKEANQILANANIKRVLLLRDPFNNFASRIEYINARKAEGKIHCMNRMPVPYVTNIWKSYAQEYLGDTNILGDELIRIDYNRWFGDRLYRDELLLTHFGQKNKDIGKDDVPREGKGSSRDGLIFQGRASEMDVLTRWKDHIYDPVYASIFRDPEVIDLSRRAFGDIPGIEQLLDYYSTFEGTQYGRSRERV